MTILEMIPGIIVAVLIGCLIVRSICRSVNGITTFIKASIEESKKYDERNR